MKDRQTPATGPQPRIPIISAVLHWLAVPAIVYFRSGFGFSFLSPKSVFLAFSWATLLFTAYVWLQEGAWRFFWALSSFFTVAVILYVLHLTVAFVSETRKTGKHDFFSGTSHLLRLPGLKESLGNPRGEVFIHLWIEPALVLAGSTVLRVIFAERFLSKWLVIVGIAMWLKEFLNYWYQLRHRKKQEDVFADAEEATDNSPASGQAEIPSAKGRKPRAKRPRLHEGDGQGDEERFFAEVLRLMPPYRLEQAEENYRALMASLRSKPEITSAEESQQMEDLNAAVEFFRRQSGG